MTAVISGTTARLGVRYTKVKGKASSLDTAPLISVPYLWFFGTRRTNT